MASSYPLITTNQYKEESSRWLSAIKRRESVVVTFFPKTDRLLRLQQLVENRQEMKSVLGDVKKYIFLVFEFGLHNVEDGVDLQNHISGKLNLTKLLPRAQSFEQWLKYLQKNQLNLILVNPQVEKLWSAEGSSAQTALSYAIDQYYPLISTLSLSEVDPTHPSILLFLPDSMRLYQNIFYYPLYSTADSLAFIRYLQIKWNMQLTKDVENRIIRDCGGHFWLLKEALRQSEAMDSLYPGEGLKFRLEVIHSQLQDSEQRVLSKCIRRKENFTEDETHSLDYLQKMHVLDKNNNCLIELFSDFVLNRHESKTGLTVKDKRVLLNHVPMETFFSRKEYRVIRILLEKRGETVSRDEMARYIWPVNTQEHYSDWAIDQLISRVRRRLQQLSLSPKLLLSVRGKGYIFKNV